MINKQEDRPLKLVEKYVENATLMCLSEWRKLPHIVSHIHLPYLQAAQQVRRFFFGLFVKNRSTSTKFLEIIAFNQISQHNLTLTFKKIKIAEIVFLNNTY